MMAHITASGNKLQPRTVRQQRYSLPMPESDARKILWTNVQALMDWRYGGESQGRFIKDTGCGNGTITRIKQQRTSVGIETLQKIARAYGLEPWHLLVPGLDPTNPPVVWLTETERELYKRLKVLAQDIGRYSSN
jgi:hypothetical protein